MCAIHPRPDLRLPGVVAVWSVLSCIASSVALTACTPDPVDEEDDEVVAPVPGFVVSIPFETRALADVTIVDTDDTGATAAWAVGTGGAVLHFNGLTWQPENSGVTVDLESVFGIIDPDGDPYVVAVGADGIFIERVGAGDWRAVPTTVEDRLFGVWIRARDDIFAVGDNGRVLRFDGEVMQVLVDEVLIDTGAVDDNGVAIAFPISEPLKGVMGRDDEVFAVGPRGSVYRFDGERFGRETSLTNRPLADVFTEAGVWAAATDGVLMRRREGVWDDTEYTAPVPAFLQGIWARDDGNVFAVGLTPELFHLVNGQWTTTTIGARVEMRAIDGLQRRLAEDAVEGTDPGIEIMAVGAGGRIVRGPDALPRAGETSLTTTTVVEENE